MKKQTSLALAAAVLLSSVTAAAAATMSNTQPSDTLNLTGTQQHAAWRDLSTPPLNQNTPSGFSTVVGAVVPNSVTTAPMPSKAASDIPALKPYNFAMLQKKIVIVNPTDKKIADVITR
jgi:hypothetical protein